MWRSRRSSITAGLEPGEMLDGLGMAETTPGPLIMVLQFVGFMAAFRDPGTLSPMLAGTLGGLLATWVTFTPCFLWIFLGAPFIETLRGNKGLAGALGAITAAVVGVILNLSIWFALHTVFRRDLAGSIVRAVIRHAGVVERRCGRAGFGGRGGDRDLPLQYGNADGAGGLMRRRRAVAAGGGDLSSPRTTRPLVMHDQLHDGGECDAAPDHKDARHHQRHGATFAP